VAEVDQELEELDLPLVPEDETETDDTMEGDA
jgi:hypothetical protein